MRIGYFRHRAPNFLCPYCDKWNDLSPKSQDSQHPFVSHVAAPSPPAVAPLAPPATWPKTMPAQEEVTPDGAPSNTVAWDSAKPRPWRRLFARYLDLEITGAIPLSITAPILLHFFPSPLPDAWTFLGGLGICFAVALESLFLSRFATTPGKWLLGISVREGDGES